MLEQILTIYLGYSLYFTSLGPQQDAINKPKRQLAFTE